MSTQQLLLVRWRARHAHDLWHARRPRSRANSCATTSRGKVRVSSEPLGQAEPLGGRAVKVGELLAGFGRMLGFHKSYVDTLPLEASAALIGSAAEPPITHILGVLNPEIRRTAANGDADRPSNCRPPRPCYGSGHAAAVGGI